MKSPFISNQSQFASPGASQTLFKFWALWQDSCEQLAKLMLCGTQFGKHQTFITYLILKCYSSTPSLPLDLKKEDK